jgi:hypothetical protein
MITIQTFYDHLTILLHILSLSNNSLMIIVIVLQESHDYLMVIDYLCVIIVYNCFMMVLQPSNYCLTTILQLP